MGWNFYNSNGEALVQHAESEATKAEMEAETASPIFVPPDLVKNSPGVAKAWFSIAADGSLESPDYGISTIGDTGTGQRDINFTTAFSSTVYAMPGLQVAPAAVTGTYLEIAARTTADTDLSCRDASNLAKDIASVHAIFGDQ